MSQDNQEILTVIYKNLYRTGCVSLVGTALILSVAFSPQKTLAQSAYPLQWEENLSGVWQAVVNQAGPHNFVDLAAKKPRAKAIKALGQTSFPLEREDIYAEIRDGQTYLRLPLQKGEQIYGLGLNFKSIQQTGQVKRLHMDHYGNSDNGRTHAPVPFYVSSRGYGVFINSTQYIDIYVGSAVRKDNPNAPTPRDRNTDPNWSANPFSDAIEILIPAEQAELIVFEGNTPMKAVQRFNLFFGGGVIPPKWGLGFWHRTPTLYGDQDVMQEIAEFEKNNFPLDVIGLEPGWHSKSYPGTFEWDSERFPEPSAFIRKAESKQVKINLWCNPYLSPESTMYDALNSLSASHTVWGGIVPDLNLEAVRTIYGEHLMEHEVGIGVSGFKIDEVDGYDHWLWPDVATFPSGVAASQMRQTYGLQFMNLVTNLYRQRNTRTYGLVRANNAGGVALPYVLYNDQYAHQDFITGLINSSFCGVLWVPEVRSSKTAEEWLRRMQTSCFSPMAMINAWSSGTQPWSFPEVYEACQEVAFLRMQLLPYLYSTFAQYYFEGIPPFRAMVLEDDYRRPPATLAGELDDTSNPYQEAIRKENTSQYMMGDNLMVAPLFAGEKEREVILPSGRWYDFYTGELVGNGEVINVAAPLNQIPLFVKDGGIIPMMDPIRQTSEWTEDTSLEIRVYGTAPGTFTLYDDDGASFDFEQGEYTTKLLDAENGTGKLIDLESNGPWTYGKINWVFMSKN